MPKPVVHFLVLALGSIALGCGPGAIASDGSSFGDGDSGTADDEVGDSSTSMSEPGNPSTGTTLETSSDDATESETDTESGANDWTDPDLETDTETDTDEPPLIDADCTLVWTHVDSEESHGHIGATPIGPGPGGGLVSVTPILASADGVNVDARIRSWSPSGALSWDEQVSWADHRDDPLALLTDELDDIYLAGRINANTFEDAMVSKLDSESGELLWTFLRGEGGGYSSIAYNGAALLAAGMIDGFNGLGLELVALDPDNGELLWSSDARAVGEIAAARGLVVADGSVDVLISRLGSVELLRFDPPAGAPTTLASLPEPVQGGVSTPQDLERFGEHSLAALYNLGGSSFLAIVDHQSGELLELRELDDFADASSVTASELVELPGGAGLGIAGIVDINLETQTFVLRLDAELNPICSGLMSETDLGLAWPPLLRGLVVGEDGALYTGSYVVTPRRQVFARWD